MSKQYCSNLLDKLKECLRKGDLTPCDRIGPGTFVCLIIKLPTGDSYSQLAFDSLPPLCKNALMGKPKGYQCNEYRVLAVFDTWPVMVAEQAPYETVYN